MPRGVTRRHLQCERVPVGEPALDVGAGCGYISDKNHASGYGLRALRLDRRLQDLNASALPEVNLTSWCGAGGCQGLAAAGPRDILYVASGDQSFDTGYVDEADTLKNELAEVVNLTYCDRGFVHVDWYDPKRAFVATFDGRYNDPDQALYLHLIYDGSVVDSLRLLNRYDEYDGLRGMAAG